MINLIKKVWGKIVTPVKNDESIFVACFSLVVIGLIIYIFTSQPGQFSLRDNSLFKETQTFSPTTTQAPSPAVRAAKTVKVIPTVDPDPIVACNIHADCGGGSKQMRKSECNQTTCCQIGDKWYFYLSSEKCTQDQQSRVNSYKGDNSIPTYNPPSSSTYTPAPYPTALPTYPPCTIYYPALGYSKTYDYTSPEDCNYWKEQNNDTSLQDAIQEMHDIVNEPLPGITVAPVDYTIHIDPTPTPLSVPIGYP